MHYDEFPAMSTTVQLAAEGDPARLRPAFDQVRRFVEQSERRFSRFLDDSELARLNRSAGHWFEASGPMLALITEALYLYHLTDGLFDPSVLSALRLAGYDRDLNEIRGQDLPASLPPNRPFLPFDRTSLDHETGGIRLAAGMQIDLGGIAKGWIASQAAKLLLAVTEVCAVGAGGDMALVGLPATASAWEIGLEDPRQAERMLAVLRVQPGGLATSTVTRRRWTQAGVPRHHIIDPRSGAPSDSPWLSVTVSHPSPTLSEAFAKALLIAGPSAAPALATKAQGLRYLAIGPAGELAGNFEQSEIINAPEPVG